MILNTGNRTDIPAYYSEWFLNRVKVGNVMVRNPFNPKQITKYKLSPCVIDVICFCTKNPTPMLEYLDEIKTFNQFWFVSITPYGKDVEPNVPDKYLVIEAFKKLSTKVGSNCVSWRYDPIFINEKYTIEYHIRAFEKIAKQLRSYTTKCTISFIDLYEKTKRNFPLVQEVTKIEQEKIVEKFVEIANKNNIEIYTCSESPELGKYGINVLGCMTKQVLEEAIGYNLKIPKSNSKARLSCNCVLGNDIGVYNTCFHACKYCYANYDMSYVRKNRLEHDVNSPLLIGNINDDDIIKEASQKLYQDKQLSLF